MTKPYAGNRPDKLARRTSCSAHIEVKCVCCLVISIGNSTTSRAALAWPRAIGKLNEQWVVLGSIGTLKKSTVLLAYRTIPLQNGSRPNEVATVCRMLCINSCVKGQGVHTSAGSLSFKKWASLNRFESSTNFVLGGVRIGMACMNKVTSGYGLPGAYERRSHEGACNSGSIQILITYVFEVRHAVCHPQRRCLQTVRGPGIFKSTTFLWQIAFTVTRSLGHFTAAARSKALR